MRRRPLKGGPSLTATPGGGSRHRLQTRWREPGWYPPLYTFGAGAQDRPVRLITLSLGGGHTGAAPVCSLLVWGGWGGGPRGGGGGGGGGLPGGRSFQRGGGGAG